jgi:hypothetical protein
VIESDMDRPCIFISWSGHSSRAVGEALRNWLPNLFQFVDVWISTEDLNKGTRWQSETVKVLQTSRFGIVCLTPDNLASSWLLFEAGAISNLPQSRVFTFLHKLEYPDVKQPLEMFNHTTSTKEDVRKMVLSLNAELGEAAVKEAILANVFEKFWPDLDAQLATIQPGSHPEGVEPIAAPHVGDAEIIREILTIVRDTSRNVAAVQGPTVPHESSKTIRSIVMGRLSDKLRRLGVPIQQMSMPVESPGGIKIRMGERDVELSIGEAADAVDGLITPVEFLKRIGA